MGGAWWSGGFGGRAGPGKKQGDLSSQVPRAASSVQLCTLPAGWAGPSQ